MTQTTSNGSSQILTAAGPSLPVPIHLDAQQSTLAPGIFVNVSPDSDLYGRVEISCDRPDASGNMPNPGNWFSYAEFNPIAQGAVAGALTMGRLASPGSQYGKLDRIVSAVRFNVLYYGAGSATFAVTQSRVPLAPGASFPPG